MDTSPFYRPIRPELCQGDIFDCLPMIHLKGEPRLLRPVTLSGKRSGYELGDALRPELPAKARHGTTIAADCDASRAILLTFDCEIDKDKYRTVALVRALDLKMSDKDLEIIRQNRRYPFFYLPDGGPDLPECYVDFRRLCALSATVVDGGRRLAGLDEVARHAMLFQFVRYFARIDLKPELFAASDGN